MPLSPYRVLDLTQSNGVLCAQILGDLGADVIQIEPPGGAAGRKLGPFANGHANAPEHSLFWWAYSRGKRSLELDIVTSKELYLQLVAHADFLIEAEPPGSLAAKGLDYDSLAAINPGLIMVSLTPYGCSGPKALWAASDITLAAASGPMSLTGDEDRPPLRVSVPQVWHHAALDGATAALIALHERHQSGHGQHIDISAQQAMTFATQGYILSTAVNDLTAQRIAGGVKAGDLRLRLTYPAKDGHVSITHLFGATLGPPTARLMDYVFEEGFCDIETRDKDWIEYGLLLSTGEEPLSEFERVKECIANCTASKSKAELLEAAMARRLLLAPMSTVKDVIESDQFSARNYFIKPLGESEASESVYPGPFAKFSKSPLNSTSRPPTIGEHNADILEELKNLEAAGVPTERSAPDKPLAGVKILDFMWALAGPGATRILADWGATVIRIESSTKLCVTRTLRPFMDQDESTEKSAIFHSTNAGKRMLTLDLTTEAGLSVARDLVQWADVVTESFSPRAMKSFGLDYPSLTKIKPEIIMLSTCLFGQTGPLSNFAGYGNLAAAITGFYAITGWPDREPAGPFGAYTDYIAPRYNAIAILAALDHKRRTGEGQHIDLAQAEAALHFTAPALLDFVVNKKIQTGNGNRDLNFAPHNAYKVKGEDQYIAIACETERHWSSLCDLIPGLDRLLTANQRLERQDELDDKIAKYVREQNGRQLEATLQENSIPSALLQNSPELINDPQLLHRGHFIELPHHEGGQTVIEGSRIQMSRSNPYVDQSAPTFNRDMMFVLEEVLRYDNEKIGELLISGALE